MKICNIISLSILIKRSLKNVYIDALNHFRKLTHIFESICIPIIFHIIRILFLNCSPTSTRAMLMVRNSLLHSFVVLQQQKRYLFEPYIYFKVMFR